jgi:hypothetical protein
MGSPFRSFLPFIVQVKIPHTYPVVTGTSGQASPIEVIANAVHNIPVFSGKPLERACLKVKMHPCSYLVYFRGVHEKQENSEIKCRTRSPTPESFIQQLWSYHRLQHIGNPFRL